MALLFSKTVNENKATLPFDFTREVPAAALKWLLQYGLPWSYWQETIGFSPSTGRLVFKVGDYFSIGRLIPELCPHEHKGRKWYVWGEPHKHCEVVGNKEASPVVLVEDLVSAHKVGLVTQAIPLFGTEIHPPVLYYLMQAAKPVVLWLDKDQQGSIIKKASQLQTLLGMPVKTVITDKDPKCLNSEQILTVLMS